MGKGRWFNREDFECRRLRVGPVGKSNGGNGPRFPTHGTIFSVESFTSTIQSVLFPLIQKQKTLMPCESNEEASHAPTKILELDSFRFSIWTGLDWTGQSKYESAIASVDDSNFLEDSYGEWQS